MGPKSLFFPGLLRIFERPLPSADPSLLRPLPAKHGEFRGEEGAIVAFRGGDGRGVGRGRRLHRGLRLPGHLVHRSCPPDSGPAVQTGQVPDGGRCCLGRHLELLVDLLQVGVHQGDLQVLAGAGRWSSWESFMYTT